MIQKLMQYLGLSINEIFGTVTNEIFMEIMFSNDFPAILIHFVNDFLTIGVLINIWASSKFPNFSGNLKLTIWVLNPDGI